VSAAVEAGKPNDLLERLALIRILPV